MTPPRRLVPAWYAACVLGLLGLVTGVALVAAIVEDGAVGLAWGLAAGAGVLFLLAAVVALLWPRRRLELAPTRRIGRARVVGRPGRALVGSWMLALGSATAWIYLALTDLERVSEEGPLAVLGIGAVASLPELVRLLRGRLHRWRITLTREGLTYQGYRRARSEPWSAVRGATTVRGRDAGVRIDLKASRPDLVIPVTAFLADPHSSPRRSPDAPAGDLLRGPAERAQRSAYVAIEIAM